MTGEFLEEVDQVIDLRRHTPLVCLHPTWEAPRGGVSGMQAGRDAEGGDSAKCEVHTEA